MCAPVLFTCWALLFALVPGLPVALPKLVPGALAVPWAPGCFTVVEAVVVPPATGGDEEPWWSGGVWGKGREVAV